MLRSSLIAACCFFAAGCVGAEPAPGAGSLTPVESRRIDEALPASAPAKPRQARRVLLFYRTEGFVHQSIPHGIEAIRRMGEKTGAFATVARDDIAAFEPQALETFDAVLFLNTTQPKFQNPRHRQSLLEFVRSGKGLIGIHAALDNFVAWPEAQAAIGGTFHSHPWNAGDTVAVKLDEPGHVLMKPFENRGFWLREEIYQVMGPYGRNRQRVLMSLDMSVPQNQEPGQIVRDDNDIPLSWIKTEGAGRVFYSSLGHNKNIYWTPQVLQHFLAGIQFALGDLNAESTPSDQLSPAPVVAFPQEMNLLNP